MDKRIRTRVVQTDTTGVPIDKMNLRIFTTGVQIYKKNSGVYITGAKTGMTGM